MTAQDATFPLWPQGAPDAIANSAYTEGVNYWNGNRGWPLIVRVKEPSIEVFRPRSAANGTAVIVFPGGGYTAINIEKEGRDAARWLASLGVTAFVVKYRLPNPSIMKDRTIGPLQDAQAAIRFVRRRAGEWHVRPDRIGVMGFSAGGHLAACLSTLYSVNTYTSPDATSARPDFAILVYPLISMRPELTGNGLRHDLLGEKPSAALMDKFSAERHVTSQTPPTFLAHAKNDQAVPVAQSIRYADALTQQGVPVELHVYEHGNHGFGLGATADWPRAWLDDLKAWLKTRSLLDG